MSQRNQQDLNLITGAVATGQTSMVLSKDFQKVVIEVVTTGFSGTLNFFQGNGATPPILANAVSATNKYSPVKSTSLDTGVVVSGTTGYTYTLATNVEYFEINTALIGFVGAKFTRTAGSITLNILLGDNQ